MNITKERINKIISKLQNYTRSASEAGNLLRDLIIFKFFSEKITKAYKDKVNNKSWNKIKPYLYNSIKKNNDYKLLKYSFLQMSHDEHLSLVDRKVCSLQLANTLSLGRELVGLSGIFNEYFSDFDFSDDAQHKSDYLGLIFDEVVNASEKQFTGQVRTPDKVVDFIIEYATNQKFFPDLLEQLQWKINHNEKFKIIDPTCGTGTFLFKFYLLIKEKYGAEFAQKVSKNLYGYDINTNMVCSTLANFLFRGLDIDHIEERDIIFKNDHQKYDLILTNPPFDTHGNTSLYRIDKFIKYICEHLKDNGYAFYICPLSFLTGESSSIVASRKAFIKGNQLISLFYLPDDTFINAKVQTAIITICKQMKNQDNYLFLNAKQTKKMITGVNFNNFVEVEKKIPTDKERYSFKDALNWNENFKKDVTLKSIKEIFTFVGNKSGVAESSVLKKDKILLKNSLFYKFNELLIERSPKVKNGREKDYLFTQNESLIISGVGPLANYSHVTYFAKSNFSPTRDFYYSPDQYYLFVKDKNKTNLKFYYYLLQSAYVNNLAKNFFEITPGWHIGYPAFWANLLFPSISIDEQNEFVKKTDAIENQRMILDKKLQNNLDFDTCKFQDITKNCGTVSLGNVCEITGIRVKMDKANKWDKTNVGLALKNFNDPYQKDLFNRRNDRFGRWNQIKSERFNFTKEENIFSPVKPINLKKRLSKDHIILNKQYNKRLSFVDVRKLCLNNEEINFFPTSNFLTIKLKEQPSKNELRNFLMYNLISDHVHTQALETTNGGRLVNSLSKEILETIKIFDFSKLSTEQISQFNQLACEKLNEYEEIFSQLQNCEKQFYDQINLFCDIKQYEAPNQPYSAYTNILLDEDE